VKLRPELPLLTDAERACLDRYVDLLEETLGDELLEVSVYGSVARGESWPAGMPIRSDLDLLIVTSQPVATDVADALVDATMPLFLESGRQLGPVFKTRYELDHPKTAWAAEFLAQFRRDAVLVYGRPGSQASA
jgi:predicted nucleotidyltransferase